MAVTKFNRDQLNGRNIHIHKRHGNTSYKTHWHEYFEIVHYRGCHGTCVVNGRDYEITDNCIFLVTPTDFHKIDTGDSEDARSTVVSFSEGIIDEKLFKRGGIMPRVLYGPSKFVGDCIAKLTELYRDAGQNATAQIGYLINFVLAEIIEHGTPTSENNIYFHPTVRKAITYMLANTSADITLSSVAEMCSMTPSYFSTLFHDVMGKTFKSWLSEVRIEHAKRMLEENEYSVLSVSYECGYNTPSHFIKSFKAATGKTPTEYRKLHKA